MWVVPIKLRIVGLFKGNWVGSDSLGMVSMATFTYPWEFAGGD